jgi:hypothetical protein
MDPKTKKRLIIGISLTTILGVGGYFLYKYLKDNNKLPGQSEDEGNSNDDSKVVSSVTSTPVIPAVSPNNTSSSSSSDRPGDVLIFQKWANENGYTPKLDEDGLWGPKTSSAWKSKKAEYNKSTEEKADPTTGLSGQQKVIWDAWQNTSSIKPTTKIAKGKGAFADKTFIYATGNVSGKRYSFGPGGLFYAWNKLGGTHIASGNYTNDGKTIVATFGPGKGKTFTSTSALKTANETSTNPQSVQTLSASQVADIVAKFYYAMKGGGTYTNTFLNNWKRMSTAADWTKVYHTFGKKEGDTLWKWMSEENELMTPSNKAFFNKWFKDRGSSNRF